MEHIKIAIKKIKLALVFFCLALGVGCEIGEQVAIEQIDYEDQKAIGVTFTANMDVETLRVFVEEESQTSVIGVIVGFGDKHQFSPVIPFTPGQTYTIRKKDGLVMASFTVPESKTRTSPEVLAIYPLLDTVPENLLKMYIEFSEPMQEVGHALDFIKVTNDGEGKEIAPFLQLESELWNTDRTLLTLWLDPGRIKTDLIPNREKGLPLREGLTYTMTIASNWKSRSGMTLNKGYIKKFMVGKRDDQKPRLETWRVQLQESDSLQGLNINFGEPMDAFLAQETIHFHNMDNTQIDGSLMLLENQSQLLFIPDSAWPGQEIEIRVQSRLEDMAGNNLLKRFDSPIGDENYPEADTTKIHSLKFKIKNF